MRKFPTPLLGKFLCNFGDFLLAKNTRAEREIELIQEYRTRLVSDVVTGKIDVRSIDIPDFEPIEADWEVPDEEESEGELIAEGIEE